MAALSGGFMLRAHESGADDGPQKYATTLVLTDLLEASLMTAITGSIVNAAALGSHHGIIRKAPYYLPGPMVLYRSHLLPLVTSAAAEPHAASVLEELYCRLELARRTTECEVAGIADAGGDRTIPAAATITHLAETWCGLALFARAAAWQLQSVMDRQSRDRSARHVARIDTLLKSVAAGGTPCIDRSGAVIGGSGIDRRHVSRMTVNIKVRLETSGGVQDCVLRDVSSNGVGVDGVGHVEPGAMVQLTWDPSRVLIGTVAWVGNGRAGIKLAGDLERDDPLLERARS